MNRKDFFKESFKCLIGKGLEIFSDNPVISYLEKSALKKERPPGAVTPDSTFEKLCTGCDACMIACPVNIIFIEDQTRRYPVIYPESSPCLHCTGYPCIASCPTGALALK